MPASGGGFRGSTSGGFSSSGGSSDVAGALCELCCAIGCHVCIDECARGNCECDNCDCDASNLGNGHMLIIFLIFFFLLIPVVIILVINVETGLWVLCAWLGFLVGSIVLVCMNNRDYDDTEIYDVGYGSIPDPSLLSTSHHGGTSVTVTIG
ncbi:hypothetical protein PCE1_000323 [Barthelona sp. PCE]